MFKILKFVITGRVKILIVISLFFMSGCAVYAPPYGGYGYGYGVAPVLPVPVFGFGWGYRGFRR